MYTSAAGHGWDILDSKSEEHPIQKEERVVELFYLTLLDDEPQRKFAPTHARRLLCEPCLMSGFASDEVRARWTRSAAGGDDDSGCSRISGGGGSSNDTCNNECVACRLVVDFTGQDTLQCSKGGGIIHADCAFTQRIGGGGSKHYCSHCASSLALSPPPQKCVSCSNILREGDRGSTTSSDGGQQQGRGRMCASCVQAFEVSVFGMEEETY